MTRAALLEQRRVELAATAQLQRGQLRTHAAALMEHVPRLGGGAAANMLKTAALVSVAAAVLARPGATRAIAALTRAGTLAARCWVIARLGWQFVQPWLTRPPAVPATKRSSP